MVDGGKKEKEKYNSRQIEIWDKCFEGSGKRFGKAGQGRSAFFSQGPWRGLHKGGGIGGGSLAYILEGSIYTADVNDFSSEEVLLDFPSLTLKSLQRNCNKQIYFLQKESALTPWHSCSTYFTHGIFYVWESRPGNGSNTQGPQNIYIGKYT